MPTRNDAHEVAFGGSGRLSAECCRRAGPGAGASEPPERPAQPHRPEVVARLRGLAALVAALEPPRVPAAREAPERGEIHDGAALVPGANQPCGDARLPAEQALMAARAHDVVPH